MAARAGTYSRPSLFARAAGLFQREQPQGQRPPDESRDRPSYEDRSVTLHVAIQRPTEGRGAAGWETVDSADCSLRVARFSPGIPPAWQLTLPLAAIFQAGDRLVIGERIFQPVVITPSRRRGMRELIALEQ